MRRAMTPTRQRRARARVLTLAAAAMLLAGVSRAVQTSYYCPPGGGTVSVTADSAFVTPDASQNPPLPELCTWVIGRPGTRASLTFTGVYTDPGLSWAGACANAWPHRTLLCEARAASSSAAPSQCGLATRAAVYDGNGTDPSKLLLRVLGFAPPLPPPILSSSTYLTVFFYSEPFSYGGFGFTANVTLSAANGTSPPSPRPPPPRPPPQSASSGSAPALAVTTGAALASALASGAAAVTLRANVSLVGVGALSLSGASAALAVTSDAAACGSSGCIIDCGGASRAFVVAGGAALTLQNVGLANCAALQGGAALALGARTVLRHHACLWL